MKEPLTLALTAVLDAMCIELDKLEQADMISKDLDPSIAKPFYWRERQKFCAIDTGSSGAWLVEKATGEIYNIMGYGTPDRNKKRKADIGNIYSVDPARLHMLRWNYLR